jgi:hypothetical protein
MYCSDNSPDSTQTSYQAVLGCEHTMCVSSPAPALVARLYESIYGSQHLLDLDHVLVVRHRSTHTACLRRSMDGSAQEVETFWASRGHDLLVGTAKGCVHVFVYTSFIVINAATSGSFVGLYRLQRFTLHIYRCVALVLLPTHKHTPPVFD